MKNLLKSLFAFMILISGVVYPQLSFAQSLAPFPAKYSFVNELEKSNLSLEGISLKEIIIPAENSQYSKADLIPIPFENLSKAMENLGLQKKHLLMVSIFLSVFFLVLSHKNRFETEIYEFYHRSESGAVLFENVEMAKSHEFKSYLSKLLKVFGLVAVFTSLVLVIF